MSDCAILSARNEDVDNINREITDLLDDVDQHIYTAIDTVINNNNRDFDDVIMPEHLNALNPPCLPPYKLHLKKNCIVMLIRNISINEGLCNGDKKGQVVFLNRITLYCENEYPFAFKRRQFPVKLAFAMTINKAQGQTFKKVVIDLRKDVFSHGQFVKHGGGLVMVWGCFAGSNVGDIVKIDGILNKEGYKKILQYHAVKSGLRLVGQPFEFQHDNDPKHTSTICKNYLSNLEKQKKLKVMQWPPQSPDLNPIELLWEELDRAVRKNSPSSATNLWEVLKREWVNIKQETLDKLVARMPRICKAVIKHKGGHFDEKKV
ncbi:uncharacterized protein LOC131663549 [Phymastichus coffea]|uniref:uncharacterized protein LOC131663549 n=1 Tax=Phymastichus coffea TaxID=108790 RepID=UPI00273AA387|nr:uncharacterized protein LOC131663549 [Phymastichus coffea]